VHTVVVGIVVVGGSLLLTLLGVALVRRLVSHRTLAEHNDVAGFVYATTGVMYAVILAFVVIAVWENYDNAKDVADAEANALAVLYRIAAGFPDPHRAAAQAAAVAYAEAVVGEEWPAMAAGTAPGPRTTAALNHLYAVYGQPALVAAVNQAQYAASLDLLKDVTANRRKRILQSEGALPPIIWVALVGGGALLVGFAYLFGVERPRSQGAILGALAVTVALLLFVVWALDRPFGGELRVGPEGMELSLQQVKAGAGAAASPTP
jgi:hypothetical protein